MGMATYHVYLHFGNSNWFSKFRKQKSQVTRILWLVALVTLITGIVAIIHWVTTFTHAPIGGVHGKLGFLMIILSIGHIVKRIKFFKGKKRMAPPSPGKASLWYADNAGRRHITVSARGLLSSGKWGSGRKNPYQARRKRTRMNGRESQRLHQRSRCLPVIGVPPVPIGAMRSMGVSACTVTFWRHHRRQHGRPHPLLPLSRWLLYSIACIKTVICNSGYSNSRCTNAQLWDEYEQEIRHNKALFQSKTHSIHLVKWNICRILA